jgi:hypothetical protein
MRKRRTGSKPPTPRRSRRRRKCTCVFDWGVRDRVLPDGTVAMWVPHEPHCPLAATPPPGSRS